MYTDMFREPPKCNLRLFLLKTIKCLLRDGMAAMPDQFSASEEVDWQSTKSPKTVFLSLFIQII